MIFPMRSNTFSLVVVASIVLSLALSGCKTSKTNVPFYSDTTDGSDAAASGGGKDAGGSTALNDAQVGAADGATTGDGG